MIELVLCAVSRVFESENNVEGVKLNVNRRLHSVLERAREIPYIYDQESHDIKVSYVCVYVTFKTYVHLNLAME